MKFQTQNIHHVLLSTPPKSNVYKSSKYTNKETILKSIASCQKKKTILICIFKMFQEIKCLKLSQLIKKTQNLKPANYITLRIKCLLQLALASLEAYIFLLAFPSFHFVEFFF